ncbi:DUF5719 family protein [Streptomyces sp. M19]
MLPSRRREARHHDHGPLRRPRPRRHRRRRLRARLDRAADHQGRGGQRRGLQGTACTAPDTDFWFPAASIAKDRHDYAHLTNPDATPAVVDIELYGPEGRIEAPTGEEIAVPARSTVSVLLSTLTTETATDVTAHVTARSGRVGAAVQANDDSRGGDWLAASAEPRTSAVLPGIPADATSVRLVVFATGGQDADLNLRLAGAAASITPPDTRRCTSRAV